MTQEQPGKRLELNVTKVAAGSLAAVTSAVAASRLGDGGTLVGAGVGSVVATVGGAVYEHYLDRTRHRVRSVVLRRYTGPAAADSTRVDAETTRVNVPLGADLADGTDNADREPTPSSLPVSLPAPTAQRETSASEPARAPRRARRLALAATALTAFGIGVGVLTGVEAITGKPVSSTVRGTDERGTSISHVFSGGAPASDGGSGTRVTPSPSATTGDEPTANPTSSPETAEPTPTESPATAPPGGEQPTPQQTGAPAPTAAAG